AFMPDPHAMLTLYAATSRGTPAPTLTCRPVFGPFPACLAWPRIVCCTCSGPTFARRIAARAARTPRSTAGIRANDPRNLPIGVRAPSRITAVSMRLSLSAGRPTPALVEIARPFQRPRPRQDPGDRGAPVDGLRRRLAVAGFDAGRVPRQPGP